MQSGGEREKKVLDCVSRKTFGVVLKAEGLKNPGK